MSNTSFNRYTRLWMLLTGGALAALAGINVVVNPIHLFGSGGSPLSAYRTVDGSWPAKIEELRGGQWQGAIIGSSRAVVGLDPKHTGWGERAVYNAAILGARRVGTSKVLRFAIDKNSISDVVLVIDFYGFSMAEPVDTTVDLARINSERPVLRHYAESTLGLWATRQSLRTIRAAVSGSTTRYDDRGMMRFKSLPSGFTHKDAFEKIFIEQLAADEWLAHFEYDPAAVDLLKADLAYACKAEVRLALVIPPLHSLHLELINRAGLWPVFENWKRDLVAAVSAASCEVSLWDFSGYQGPTTEVVPRGPEPMEWFWESSHFKKELGDRVLDRVLLGTSESALLGVRLDSQNIDAELQRTRELREVYRAEHAAEIRWFEETLTAAGY